MSGLSGEYMKGVFKRTAGDIYTRVEEHPEAGGSVFVLKSGAAPNIYLDIAGHSFYLGHDAGRRIGQALLDVAELIRPRKVVTVVDTKGEKFTFTEPKSVTEVTL